MATEAPLQDAAKELDRPASSSGKSFAAALLKYLPDSRKNLISLLVFVVLLSVAAGFSTYVVFRLKPAIIPDEPFHFIMSERFSTTWGIATDSPDTYIFGPIAGRAYLYYWINGRFINALRLLRPHLSDWKTLVSLRLLNLLYSILTIVFGYLLSREIIRVWWGQLLAVFLLTNTLMFIFLSGGVNYDNLVNLCCMAAAYFLARVFNGKAFYQNSLAWLIFLCAGTLAKITVLPLALTTALGWLFYVFRKRPRPSLHGLAGWKCITLLVVAAVLVILNLMFYGGNILTYGSLQPPCTELWTTSRCSLLPYVRQNEQLMLPQKLTVIGAIRAGLPDPIDWTLNFWVGWIIMEVYGIFGHQHYFPSGAVITLYRLLILWIGFVIIRYAKKPSFTLGGLSFVGLAYLAVLLATNYVSDLASGFKHIEIQGRYIFPVIGILYTLVAYYVANIPRVWMRRATALLIVLVFLYGGLLTFWIHYAQVFEPWFY